MKFFILFFLFSGYVAATPVKMTDKEVLGWLASEKYHDQAPIRVSEAKHEALELMPAEDRKSILVTTGEKKVDFCKGLIPSGNKKP